MLAEKERTEGGEQGRQAGDACVLGAEEVENLEQKSDTCDFTVLFSDIDDEKEFFAQKPLLAHYTSISNLESILKNRQIWFSNPLYLNDHEELRFGMNEGLELLMFDDSIQEQLLRSTRSEANREKLQSHFRSLFDDFEKKHALDTFVLSFCSHDSEDNDGKLSMWFRCHST